MVHGITSPKGMVTLAARKFNSAVIPVCALRPSPYIRCFFFGIIERRPGRSAFELFDDGSTKASPTVAHQPAQAPENLFGILVL